MKNAGSGTFEAKIEYQTEAFPMHVFCADLDADLDYDLALANGGPNTFSVLENLTQIPANLPPNPFSLLWPPDSGSVILSTILDWRSSCDPDFGDQIKYDLYLSTAPSFHPDSTKVYDSLGTSSFHGTLELYTRYWWKVKAYDNRGAERWSGQTWSFYVAFRSGDANGDGEIGLSDVVHLINYVLKAGNPPVPLEAGDVNCDGNVDIIDVVYLINYLFKGGPPTC